MATGKKKKKASKGGGVGGRKAKKTKRAAKKAARAARPHAKAKTKAKPRAAARKPAAKARSSKPVRKAAAPVRAAAPGPMYGEGDWKGDEESREGLHEFSESLDTETLAAEDLEPDPPDSEDEDVPDSAQGAPEEEPEW
ncbi:MAG TPA: hypothetical protein VMQ61_03740 [Thermoanaerobaculia bacterium]|nr:hypothetical protein [Thermoanaerobaculia bacterium]